MTEYQAPEIEIIYFSAEDVIITSGGPDDLPDDIW